MTLYKKCTEKPYSLLVIVRTLASDNPLHLSFNLYPLSGFSPGKIDKYEYLTAEEILPFDQSRMIEKAPVILLIEQFYKNKLKQFNIKEKTS